MKRALGVCLFCLLASTAWGAEQACSFYVKFASEALATQALALGMEHCKRVGADCHFIQQPYIGCAAQSCPLTTVHGDYQITEERQCADILVYLHRLAHPVRGYSDAW